MSKTAIVFGGSGFLGSHVADALSESGHIVTLFDQRPSPYLRSDQTMVVGNIMDIGQVQSVLRNQEIVYHFAGLTDLDQASNKPLESVNQNILGTVHLLDAAVASGVKRFVFASTIYVNSYSGSFYRISKHACELLYEEYKGLGS